MATVRSVVEELRAKGKEKTRAIYVRHGMPADGRTLGVSTADMKLAAKKLRGEQALAMELYATGIFEARYLAGMRRLGMYRWMWERRHARFRWLRGPSRR